MASVGALVTGVRLNFGPERGDSRLGVTFAARTRSVRAGFWLVGGFSSPGGRRGRRVSVDAPDVTGHTCGNLQLKRVGYRDRRNVTANIPTRRRMDGGAAREAGPTEGAGAREAGPTDGGGR